MLSSVPQELIEHILVLTAHDGFQTTVAALSQTCKHFYCFLGLRNDNRHLWRELFLAVFGDPRRPKDEYNWQKEFVSRVQAAKYFKTWTVTSAAAKRRNKAAAAGADDEQEQTLLLFQSLRTLVASITTENSAMSHNIDDSVDNMIVFDSPSTRLASPPLIVLHALEEQLKVRGSDDNLVRHFLDSIRSPTSAWAEQSLSRGYPPALADRLRTFDPWVFRHPRRRKERKRKGRGKRKGKGKGKERVSTTDNNISYDYYSSIATDPEWELSETGRLFYKLVLMKGYLLDQSSIPRKTLNDQKRRARMLARRRIYDMRYISRDRLFGPFLPINQAVSYGSSPLAKVQPETEDSQSAPATTHRELNSPTPTSSSTNSTEIEETTEYDESDGIPPLDPISSSDGDSDGEEGSVDETTQLHLNMLTLLSAGIHPHLLLHHHFVHHGADLFPDLHANFGLDEEGGAGDFGVGVGVGVGGAPGGGGGGTGGAGGAGGGGQEAQGTHHPLISPHKIIPDYAFLAAARLLIEMNMKDTWGDVHFGHGVVFDDEGDDDGEEEEEEEGGENDALLSTLSNSSISTSSLSHHHDHTYTSSPTTEDDDNDNNNNNNNNNDQPLSAHPHTHTHTTTDPQHLLSHFIRDTQGWVERLVEAFSRLDFVRMGGAVRYWKGSGGVAERWEVGRGYVEGGGGERKEGEEEVDGWDWAGVEGEWRRVVCWMDYQDLLLHSSGRTGNLNPDYDIDEAIRLFPIKLHITKYSPPPPRPVPCPSSSPSSSSSSSGAKTQDESADPSALIWHLPVIHFTGESRVSGNANTTTSTTSSHNNNNNGNAGPENARRVRGTVRMIGDGAVRWSMVSSYINHDAPEWSMEGVQVGCIGSAVGVVGMWTGAEHVRGDPVGPCWQWKVG
ncbi:hypothetical protein AX15_004781 [Amanita polypyramis BW_CC]|nr:hypothetical protein AX15_004781 [Amanita polypyramis BW_CC]